MDSRSSGCTGGKHLWSVRLATGTHRIRHYSDVVATESRVCVQCQLPACFLQLAEGPCGWHGTWEDAGGVCRVDGRFPTVVIPMGFTLGQGFALGAGLYGSGVL